MFQGQKRFELNHWQHKICMMIYMILQASNKKKNIKNNMKNIAVIIRVLNCILIIIVYCFL